MSQRHSQSQISVSAKDVECCVRYILCREASKNPILRSDIAKHLHSNCDTQKNQVSAVIASAENVLKNVYSYKLVKDDAKGVVQYILVLKEAYNDPLPSVISDVNEQVILNAALAHIFMSGGSVKDDDMWDFLTEAGLMGKDDITAKKLLTKKFPSKLYLTCDKVGENKIQFRWGSRSYKEASKMFILKKVAEALEKAPEYWSEQYKVASSNTEEVQITQATQPEAANRRRTINNK